jgi:hypothetical protein
MKDITAMTRNIHSLQFLEIMTVINVLSSSTMIWIEADKNLRGVT